MTSDKRLRQKQYAQAAREQAAKQKSRRDLLRGLRLALGVGLAIGLVFWGYGSLGGDETPSLPPAYARFRSQETACSGSQPAPAVSRSYQSAAKQNLTEPLTAVITTSCGDITVELTPSTAPQTVNSFVFLAREGFYDATVFHRVMDGFMIQGGDPQADGFGGPGYSLPDELPNPGFVYEEGVVAMANAGPGTTGSQFFVVIGPGASPLPPNYTVIGRVTAGMDVAKRIGALEVVAQPGRTEKSHTTRTVYVESITIIEG